MNLTTMESSGFFCPKKNPNDELAIANTNERFMNVGFIFPSCVRFVPRVSRIYANRKLGKAAN